MVIRQTFTLFELAMVWFHPEVYWQLMGDMAPDPATIDLQGTIDDHRVKYWMVYKGNIPVGFHSAQDINGVYWLVASAFVPEARGKMVLTSARFALVECARLYGARKFVAEVAEDNRAALAAVRAVGFRPEGINARSFMRAGKLIDQIRLVKWSDEV